MRGRIIKGIAGFYYVRCTDCARSMKSDCPGEAAHGAMSDGGAGNAQSEDERIYECKAKGIFRKDNLKPLVGDEVEMDVLDEEKRLGNIRELLPRQNELVRPAVANVDQALVIFSIVKPKPNFNLLDRFLILMEQQGVSGIVCFNKQDIDEMRTGEKYRRIYERCGYRVLTVSATQGDGIEELKALLKDRTTVVAGPSGVGKSSLINCLQSRIVMETGELSAKIERGKHTTRHSELIVVEENTYIFDTPGFSSLELFGLEKGQLAQHYPEFAEYEKNCRFSDCSHVNERECGIRDAVAEGAISSLRYENYSLLYRELELAQQRRKK